MNVVKEYNIFYELSNAEALACDNFSFTKKMSSPESEMNMPKTGCIFFAPTVLKFIQLLNHVLR